MVRTGFMPDIRLGAVELMKGHTQAGQRVEWQVGRSTRAPRIQVEHAGSLQQQDTRVERARIVYHTYGNYPPEAWELAYEVRERLLPYELVSWGLHERVTYTDRRGEQKFINISGAQLESGPRESPEDRSHVITQYLIDYHGDDTEG